MRERKKESGEGKGMVEERKTGEIRKWRRKGRGRREKREEV